MKEARIALDWARTRAEERSPIDEMARQIGRTPGAEIPGSRRVLPPGERPWAEKPRWAKEEVDVLLERGEVERRSRAAALKYAKRHGCPVHGDANEDEDDDKRPLTVAQVARDLGLSRASVYRLLKAGVLRRFKGGIAQTTFEDLLKEHPEVIPYHKLSLLHKEWLVLSGFKSERRRSWNAGSDGWGGVLDPLHRLSAANS
jgi:hypothetical protein